MSVDILKGDLKTNKIRNLYLFYGPEEYLKGHYLKSIEDNLLNKDTGIMNRTVLEGKIEINSLMDSCETMPIFSDKRVVVVKNSGLFKAAKKPTSENTAAKSQATAKAKPSNDVLLSYLQNVSPSTCLVFYEAEIDKRIKLVDAIKKNGLIVEFPFQKPDELARWVAKAFRSYKKEIDMMTAAQLVENSEQGMNEMLNEINKVVSYLGERTRVESRDIQEVCTKSIKSRIFDLTDAIAEKHAIKALGLLNDMIVLREPIQKILVMITRQFRHVLEMKLLREEGLSPNEAASKIGMSPYAASKVSKQSTGFTIEKLKDAIKQSLEFDIAIKTGKIDERIAIELLITEFTR